MGWYSNGQSLCFVLCTGYTHTNISPFPKYTPTQCKIGEIYRVSMYKLEGIQVP